MQNGGGEVGVRRKRDWEQKKKSKKELSRERLRAREMGGGVWKGKQEVGGELRELKEKAVSGCRCLEWEKGVGRAG